MIYVLLTILFATAKVIVRVVKGKLSPDNVRNVSVSAQTYIITIIKTNFLYFNYICILSCDVMLNTMPRFQDLDELQEAETSHPIVKTNRSSTRIRSVDTFRGYFIFLHVK